MTNRPRKAAPANPPSRGLLCRTLLTQPTVFAAVALAREQLETVGYAGCNFLIASPEEAWVLELEETTLRLTQLAPGWHLITNGPLDDPDDRRIARVRSDLPYLDRLPPEARLLSAQRLCSDTGATGQAPICIIGPGRGTVSSTVFLSGSGPGDGRYWHANGSPATTAYEDFTGELRAMLRMQQATWSAHTIQLHGPWKSEPLAAFQQDNTGAGHWATESLPAAGTLRLPMTWDEAFGAFRGRVRLSRRFHRPTGIEPDDRVLVAFEHALATGEVRLNGHWLGGLSPLEPCQCFDVTNLLTGNDLLEVDVEFTAPSSSDVSVLAGRIFLEIRSSSPG